MGQRKFRFLYRKNDHGNNPSDPFLLEHQEYKCFYCEASIDKDNFTRDHLFPRKHRKTLSGNKVLACNQCNNNKGSGAPQLHHIHKAAILYDKMGFDFIVKFRKINNKIKLIMIYSSRNQKF